MSARDADRIAARRASERQSAAATAQQAAADRRLVEIDALAVRLRAAIPAALQKLEAAGFPDVEQIKFKKYGLAARLGAKPKWQAVGAWKIAIVNTWSSEREQLPSSLMPPATQPMHLTSNGRITLGNGDAVTVDEYISRVRPHANRDGPHNRPQMYRVDGFRLVVAGVEQLNKKRT